MEEKDVFKSKYQTKLNLVFNGLTFLVNAIIGIWLPPFLITRLGVDAYGLIPISMSITAIMLIVTISINGTLSRFLALDFEVNPNRSIKTFNTAFYLLLMLTVVFLPATILFSFFSEDFLNIPDHIISDAHLLFFFVFIAFFLNTFSSLYNSVAYVKNRIDLRNISIILTKVLTIVVLFAVFASDFVRIQVYGVAVLVGTVVGLVYSYRVFKKLAPELKISFKYFDKKHLSDISTMGFWIIINQIGVLFFLQSDILVINYFKGAELSGIYAVLLQWSFLIRALVAIIAGVIGPLVLNLYAKKEVHQLRKITVFSTKILGLFTVLISSVLIYFAKDILYIWIGQDFVQYKWVFILLLVHLGYNLSVSAISNLNVAYNKVKIPGIVTLITGLLNIVLGIILLVYTNLGLYGIAIAGLVALTIKNLIFTPYYAAKIMRMDLFTFYKPIIPIIGLSGIVIMFTILVPSDFLTIGDNLFKLILAMIGLAGIISLIMYQFLLNGSEKNLLLGMIKSKK
jgi:membrane protein EpsK